MRIARESQPFVLTLLGAALFGGVLLHPLVAVKPGGRIHRLAKSP